jgi:hypothetical protein
MELDAKEETKRARGVGDLEAATKNMGLPGQLHEQK